MGVEVDLRTDPAFSRPLPDVVHVGNVDRPTEAYWFANSARRRGVPVVLSPIFHPPPFIERYEMHGRRGALSLVSRRVATRLVVDALKPVAYARHHPQWLPAALRAVLAGRREMQRTIARDSAAWLLIAQGERAHLAAATGVEPAAEFLIPNGVTQPFFARPKAGGDRSGVLVVGRVEARKNQLVILRALRDTPLSVTLVGAPNRRHRAYVRSIEREIASNPRARWLKEVPYDEMPRIYRAHAVHVNASWYEVAPLVDLEAAAAGCAVISTTAGFTAEYLGGAGRYLDPHSTPEHWRGEILAAVEGWQQRGELARAVVQQFTWRNAAVRLLDAYRTVLERLPGPGI